MTDMPETIWAKPWNHFHGRWYDESDPDATEYRRADLPPTLAQALKVPEVAAMREALLAVAKRPEKMIWGEDHECVSAMYDMEAIAETALAAIEAAMKEGA